MGEQDRGRPGTELGSCLLVPSPCADSAAANPTPPNNAEHLRPRLHSVWMASIFKWKGDKVAAAA